MKTRHAGATRSKPSKDSTLPGTFSVCCRSSTVLTFEDYSHWSSSSRPPLTGLPTTCSLWQGRPLKSYRNIISSASSKGTGVSSARLVGRRVDAAVNVLSVRRCGLKTVINLQRPGEHASCGNTLEQESGFTYRPETFMEADSECPPVVFLLLWDMWLRAVSAFYMRAEGWRRFLVGVLLPCDLVPSYQVITERVHVSGPRGS